jgi:hypothetical protein
MEMKVGCKVSRAIEEFRKIRGPETDENQSD